VIRKKNVQRISYRPSGKPREASLSLYAMASMMKGTLIGPPSEIPKECVGNAFRWIRCSLARCGGALLEPIGFALPFACQGHRDGPAFGAVLLLLRVEGSSDDDQ
jgi:hypothetical protein